MSKGVEEEKVSTLAVAPVSVERFDLQRIIFDLVFFFFFFFFFFFEHFGKRDSKLEEGRRVWRQEGLQEE